MPKEPRFPAFVRALHTQDQASELKSQVHDMEGRLAGLRMNPDLAPTDAARDFVKAEDALKASLRQARLALSHADPDTSPLWRNAVSEMRHTAVAGIEAELQALNDRSEAAALRLLSPIVTAPFQVAAVVHSSLVARVNALTAEFRDIFSRAVNGSTEDIAAHATALHNLIEAIPARIKELQSMASAYEQAADAILPHLTAQEAG